MRRGHWGLDGLRRWGRRSWPIGPERRRAVFPDEQSHLSKSARLCWDSSRQHCWDEVVWKKGVGGGMKSARQIFGCARMLKL